MSPTGAVDWADAWSAALDDLELTLEQTERLLSHDDPDAVPTPASGWTPPELGAPLPPEMLDRARVLLERQQQLILATSTAITGNRRSSALLAKVADASGAHRPAHAVYLDVRA